jgi:hypothetical protein
MVGIRKVSEDKTFLRKFQKRENRRKAKGGWASGSTTDYTDRERIKGCYE